MSKARKTTPETGGRGSLRRRAEALLEQSPPPGFPVPVEDAPALVHNLQVHQVELEMQNEELRRTQLELTQSRDRFSDLYDFAPVGYLSLNPQGTVREANLTAAKMLGVPRSELVARGFSRFIERESQDPFYRHCQAVFSDEQPHTCELVLRKADGTGLPVHLESLRSAGEPAKPPLCRTVLVDLTELKRTEAALRQAWDTLDEEVRRRTTELRAANTHLEHLLASNQTIIYSCQPAGDYTVSFLSSNVREQLGYEAQEFMEDPGFWASHIHPEDKPAVFARLAGLARQGRLSLEYRFRHKEGTYRWMRDDLTLVKNSADRPQEIVGCWMDVTERRQAEEGRAQLAAIVDSSDDAIISRNLNDIIITWNEGAERVFGYSAREIVGHSFTVLVPPDRQDEVRQIRQRIEQGERVAHQDTVRVAKDGRQIPVSSLSSPVKEASGRIVGISVILRDITRQKWAEAASRRSEQALVDFFAEAPIGLLWLTPDGRILRANQAMGAMLGCGPEDLFERQWAEFGADPGVLTNLLGRLARKESLHDSLVRLRQQDGSLRHVFMDANCALEKGKLVQSRWFIRDVSRRVELEHEILVISERERQRIGQELHDDLCQQLASIEFLTCALERRLQANSRVEAAPAKEIGQLTRRAITHARGLARGMFPMELHADGLVGALRELAHRTRSLFRLDCRFCGGSSALIPDRVTQIHFYRIAQEAVQNAIKHGQATQITIGLKTAGNRIVLRVRDNGVGLPRKRSETEGLGLRIMEHRAGVLGGSVRVESPPRGGTTVVCSIPQPPLKPPPRPAP